MATIRKRGSKYQALVRRKGFGSVTKSFHTKADAAEWARFMETQADRGGLPPATKLLATFTVRDVIERYRDEISIRKRSYDTEAYILNALLRQPWVKTPLSEISPAPFFAYQERRLKVVKAGTVNRELGILKHAFTVAISEWDVPLRSNPLSKVKKLKVSNARSRRLTAEELKRLQLAVAESRNPLLMPLIQFAIATGMRRGEILRLSWPDINLVARTLHIPVTKNGHARTIPLSGQAVAILHERQIGRLDGQELVFPLSDNAAKLAWQRLVARARIADLHFHDLRHEAISQFFERGLSVPEVALISGHRDFKMLFRYTHMKPEIIAEKLV